MTNKTRNIILAFAASITIMAMGLAIGVSVERSKCEKVMKITMKAHVSLAYGGHNCHTEEEVKELQEVPREEWRDLINEQIESSVILEVTEC